MKVQQICVYRKAQEEMYTPTHWKSCGRGRFSDFYDDTTKDMRNVPQSPDLSGLELSPPYCRTMSCS